MNGLRGRGRRIGPGFGRPRLQTGGLRREPAFSDVKGAIRGRAMTGSEALTAIDRSGSRRQVLDVTNPFSDQIEVGALPEGAAGLSRKYIALIESRSFLGECIRRSMQTALPRPVIAYSTVSELERQLDRSSLELILLCLPEEGLGSTSLALKALSDLAPGVPIVVLASNSDANVARAAISDGAKGYVPATMGFEIAVEAVRFVLSGGTYVPMDYFIAPQLAMPKPATPSGVTTRELAVVRAIQQGKSNKIIAYELNMCESTVKVHVRNLMKKLNAKNRTDVAIQAQVRLVSPLSADAN